MSQLNLKAELTGKGPVNNTYIYLEELPKKNNIKAIPIALQPKNSTRKEWSHNNILVDVEGTLDLQLNIHAIMGTSWTFKLSKKEGTAWKKLYETEGETGDDLNVGNNKSIIITSITI